MIVPGSSYWNIGVGRKIGDVEQDEEGVETMRTLGRNMAWLMKRLDREGCGTPTGVPFGGSGKA
jgi:multimeric flavodoxin WrbA